MFVITSHVEAVVCDVFIVVLCLPLMETNGTHTHNQRQYVKSLLKLTCPDIFSRTKTFSKIRTRHESHVSCSKVDGSIKNNAVNILRAIFDIEQALLIHPSLWYVSCETVSLCMTPIQVKQECAGGGREPEETGLHRATATHHKHKSKSESSTFSAGEFRRVVAHQALFGRLFFLQCVQKISSPAFFFLVQISVSTMF